MKARTKIEKQVAASNEKLTAISPKVITWAVRKVAGHVCFRTSAHKCTCGDCGRHFDYEGKGKSVCCPYCGTRLQIKDTLKRTIKEAYYFSSLEVIDHLQVQRVFRLETTFRKGLPRGRLLGGMPSVAQCRRQVGCHSKNKDIGLLCGLL